MPPEAACTGSIPCHLRDEPVEPSIAAATPSRVFGWSDFVKTDFARTTTADVMQQWIDGGITVDQSMDRGRARHSLTCTSAAAGDVEITTTLGHWINTIDGPDVRLREVIHVLEPELGIPVDQLTSPLAVQTTNTATTMSFALELQVDGFTASERMGQRVGVRHPSGLVLVPPSEIPLDRTMFRQVGPGTQPSTHTVGRARWTQRVTVPRDLVSSDGELSLEAFVSLPEGGESVDRITVRPQTTGPDTWNLRATGLVAASLSGTRVRAESPRAVEDSWVLSLLTDADSTSSAATIVLRNHQGVQPQCAGATGMFTADVVFTQAGKAFTGSVQMQIAQFDRDAMVATLRGTVEALDPSRGVGEPVSVELNGALRWHRAGCHPEVVANTAYVGAIHVATTGVCTAYHSASIIASTAILQAGCAAGGATTECITPPAQCPTTARMGRCNMRVPGSSDAWRDTVQHFYPITDGPTPEELQQFCASQNGTWLAN